MKSSVLVLTFIMACLSMRAQQITVSEGAVLNGFLFSETSGLMRFNNEIFTHNDSGGETALYSLDTLSGNIIESTYLNETSNVDWEDITVDADFTYVGDFGNNLGNRTDLKIYKLDNSDLNQVTGVPGVIEFSYPEQVDFSEQLFTTNYDCEALLSWGNDLLLFTKNWGNQMTSVYRIPKSLGTHEAELLTEIDVNGFITGACYDPIGDYIVLTGYTILEPFVFIIPEGDLAGENMSRLTYEVDGGFQIEAIEQLEQNKFILSREGEGVDVPQLFYLDVDWADSIDESGQTKSLTYPNPSQGVVHISLPLSRWELHDDQGKLVLQGSSADVDLSSLNPGMYLLKVKVAGGTITNRLLRE